MHQVEDELSLNDRLGLEAAQTRQAFVSSGKVQQLALQLYQAGADNYLDVVVAEVSDLQSGVGTLGVDIRRQQASIDLVRALGGGWDTTQLPTPDKVLPFDPLLPG